MNQLLTALGTQTTLGSTKSNTDTTTLTSGNVDVTNLFSGLSYGKTNTSQNSSTDTHSNSNTASTIVCTEMLTHGLMQRKEYVTVHAHYKEHYSDHGKKAYHFWGRRIVSKLRRDRTSKVSRFLLSLFSARTNFVCWRLTGVPRGSLCGRGRPDAKTAREDVSEAVRWVIPGMAPVAPRL